MIFQVLLLFVTLAHGLRTKLHMALQAEPDVACQLWLASPAGQEYMNCDSGNPGVPVAYNVSNNCELTFADFDGYCNNSCYNITVKAWEFFLNTSTCLNVEEDKYKPCNNNTDCPTLGDGRQRVCFEGFCYNACNSTSDCNPCMAETCVTLGGSQGNATNNNATNVNGTSNNTTSQACRSANVYFVNGSALVNRTIQNTFRAQLYSLKAGCSKSANGLYCGLMDLSNQTCASLQSQWGCCASTYLPSIQYCGWTNFTNANYTSLLNNCSWEVAPCGGMDWAWQFCGFNVTNTTINNGSSSSSSSSIIGTNSSSSSSSGISSSSSNIGTNSSGSSSTHSSSSNIIIPTNSTSSSVIIGGSNTTGSNSFSGSSSSNSHSSLSSLSSHSGGVGTNNTHNNTASAKSTISWTVTIALVLAAANVV